MNERSSRDDQESSSHPHGALVFILLYLQILARIRPWSWRAS